ncbi:MAG: PD-(D/E)XK nuclease family protein [Anaerolineales bacterium]|nr:PD-(D/E)XK nuclease family protein [Anaerolineales bacterium]
MNKLQLPPTFTFSQSSLQAYTDCPRRFWLAYAEQLPWPAVEASPVQEHEEQMRQGERFHRLIERAEIGIDPVQIAMGLPAPLATWFAAYQSQRPKDLPEDFLEVEKVLTVSIQLPHTANQTSSDAGPAASGTEHVHVRLAAKYDLIAASRDGHAIIVDWKTSKRRGDQFTLRQRLQSVVYPFVLVEASARFPWGPVEPEAVEMRYWFTAAPTQSIVFRYSSSQHEANRRRLEALLATILSGRDERDYPKWPRQDRG